MYEGNIDNIEHAFFESDDLFIDQNERDNFDQTIDLGVMPSDILYYNNLAENIYVYGNDKVLILDGYDHTNIVESIPVSNAGNLYYSYFIPVTPYSYQLTEAKPYDLSHILCATNDGKLVVIDPEVKELFQDLPNNYPENVLSNSVKYSLTTEKVVWVTNFWDGTSKIKILEFNIAENIYIPVNEFIVNDNEILDFTLYENTIRIALLGSVKELDYNLSELHTIEGIQIDKLETEYGHVAGEKKIVKFLGGVSLEHITDLEGNIVEFAFGSCYDWDNDIVYFSGNDSDGFLTSNYCPNCPSYLMFKSYAYTGVISLAFNEAHDEFYYAVCAAGKNVLVGFDNQGLVQCSSEMDYLHGYRIAFDELVDGSQYSPGTIVACLKDGILRQFLRMTCIETNEFETINIGISSSISAYVPTSKKVFFFYNGQGLNNGFLVYDEIDNIVTPVNFYDNVGDDTFGRVNDCVYNNSLDKVFFTFINPYLGRYEIHERENDGTILVPEDIIIDIEEDRIPELLLAYENSIYCAATDFLYRQDFDENGGLMGDIFKHEFGGRIIAMEPNYIDNSIYIIFDNENKVIVSDHDDFTNMEEFLISINDPTDICYNSKDDNIYVSNYDTKKIKIYNTTFNLIGTLNINGYPKRLEYNAFQNNVYVVSDYHGAAFNYLSVIDCSTETVISNNQIRKSDGLIYDNVNDQLYLHTNHPDKNNENNYELNVKVFDNFNDDFSNLVNTSSYCYSDIILSRKSLVQSKPSINSEDSKIYFGNYGLSSASVINAYQENFIYRPGWSWLSFPRLERYQDNVFDAITLLEKIDPWEESPPDYLEMIYEPDETEPKFIEYTIGSGWNDESTLLEVKSSQGYKLNYIKNVPDYSLRLEGAKLDYNTEIDLVEGESWVGYFLDESYYPEQCLPQDLWDKLIQIKTQYWSMTKISSGLPHWYLQGKKAPFKYGDLVILKTNAQYNDFQWQIVGDGEENITIPKVTNYVYEEQADYTPFYVETDSTSEIQEIAVLADGEVKGAATREPGDTLVEVNGYLEGVDPGAVIEFETWNGYKSKAVGQGAYVVIDHKRRAREKRNIFAGEKANYYHVSLKSGEVYKLPPDISQVSCKPNPFKQNLEFSFRLNNESNINLEVFDMSGNLVKTIIKGTFPAGYYSFIWRGENQSGNRVQPGVYFYKLNTGNGTVLTDKLVLIK